MMPKFIVTIGDLLPPTIVLFSHSRTMPDYLRVCGTVIISSQTKYGDTFSSIMGACRRISSKC